MRRLALWLTLPTGFAGLVYEVTWEQALATLLGSHSEAAVAVLALFLGGLASGYALFGRTARRLSETHTLLRLYGGVEISIGLYALLFPWLLSGARRLSAALPLLDGPAAFATDVLLCALLLLPPAIAMGSTIPLLTQALPPDRASSTRIHARIYALNTLGAFGGALTAAFWIVPALGLSGSMRVTALLNLLAGACYLAIAARLRGTALAPEPGRGFREPAWAAAAALLLGFAMMTLQTSMLRLSALSLGGSPFTFAMVVAVFVLCIAAGSAAVSALRRVPRWLLWADVGLLLLWLVLLYPPLQDGAYYGHWLRTRFTPEISSFYPFQAGVFAALLGVIGPAALLSGASLPLLFDRVRGSRDDVGGVAGRLYAWNTLGSVAGALLGGYAIFWWLDLHHVYRVAAGAVAAALVLLGADGPPRPALRAVVLAAVCAGIALLPAWAPERLSAGAYRIRKPTPQTQEPPGLFFASLDQGSLVFYDDDPSASIAVKEFVRGGETNRNIVTNGKSDGALPAEYKTMALAGLLPALFAERAEHAFVIGLGTGATSSALASLDTVREVLVSEISPAVIRAAPAFDALNGGGSRSPRIRLVRGDAYRTLLRSTRRFDVIVSQPSNPWVAGVEMLFSADFLERGRRHLAPGGVYAQWLQIYETDAETIALALRTLAAVFEHVSVWYGLGPDLLLLAHQDAERALDSDRLERRAARPDFAAALRRAGIPDLPTLLAHELLPLGAVHAQGLEGPIHTLAHPRLRHAAAHAFHGGRQGDVPRPLAPGPAEQAERASLWRRWQRRHGPASDADWARFARETCLELRLERECVAALAAWTVRHPTSEARPGIRYELASLPITSYETRPPHTRVAALARLFDGEGALEPGDRGVREATRATRLFAEHYHPAAPVPREAIAARWRQCEAEAARREACVEARRALEQEFGPLGIAP